MGVLLHGVVSALIQRRNALVAGLWLCASLLTACSTYTFKGAAYADPPAAPDFTLSDTQGRPFRLSAHRGEVVLLNFGYTACPDVCPATLGVVQHAFDALGDRAGRVQLVFVTVDPERDTPPVLQDYLARFNPEFLGLTGSPAALAGVMADYGIMIEVETQPHGSENSASPATNHLTPNGDYRVGHTARLYLIDASGRLRVQYPFGVTADELRQDVEYMLIHGQ